MRQIRVSRRIRVGDEQNWIEARAAATAAACRCRSISTTGRTPRSAGKRFASTCTPRRFAPSSRPAARFLPEEAARAMVAQGLGLRVTPQNLLIFGPDGPIDNTLAIRQRVRAAQGARRGRRPGADRLRSRGRHRRRSGRGTACTRNWPSGCWSRLAVTHETDSAGETTLRVMPPGRLRQHNKRQLKSGGKRELSRMTTRIAQHACGRSPGRDRRRRRNRAVLDDWPPRADPRAARG